MTKSQRFLDSTAFSMMTLLVAMLSIQTGAALAKQLFQGLGAQGTTLLRLGLAALCLCGFWRPWHQRHTRREVIAVLAYGLSLGAMSLSFYMAIERIPLGIAVAIEFTGPLAVAVLSSRKPSDFLWVALATGGLVLILPISQATAALDPLGVFYALCAGICWALYILFGQRAGASAHAGTVTALGMAVAALLVLPMGAAHAGSALFKLSNLPLALGVAILSSALPFSLEMVALKRLPAKNFGILMSLEPALGAISGRLLLDEHLAATQWMAISCIILASIGSSFRGRSHVTST
jgi:inner membrane transporter RhtA